MPDDLQGESFDVWFNQPKGIPASQAEIAAFPFKKLEKLKYRDTRRWTFESLRAELSLLFQDSCDPSQRQFDLYPKYTPGDGSAMDRMMTEAYQKHLTNPI